MCGFVVIDLKVCGCVLIHLRARGRVVIDLNACGCVIMILISRVVRCLL